MSNKENVYLATIAEQAGRYEDMIEYLSEIIKANAELSAEERILLSAAYKNGIGDRRAAWRVLKFII